MAAEAGGNAAWEYSARVRGISCGQPQNQSEPVARSMPKDPLPAVLLPRPVSSKRATARIAAGALLWLGVAGVAFYLLPARGGAELARALTGRGRVLIVAPSGALLQKQAEGSELIAGSEHPAILGLLARDNPEPLLHALHAQRIDALLLEPAGLAGASLRARLERYEYVPGLRGLYLARDGALYARDVIHELPEAYRQATAVVARRLLEGARPPNLSSFPEALRRVRPVEVMVMLRRGERARLWRSARGSSIAGALITAATIARQRWQEREQAMGGQLDEQLSKLDVEVALLEEDGTLGERDPAFIDRAFFDGHGVGYERKGAWRYLLPETTRLEGKGSASRAYRKLFVDDGLPVDSFDRHELRLYRLRVQSLAHSPPGS